MRPILSLLAAALLLAGTTSCNRDDDNTTGTSTAPAVGQTVPGWPDGSLRGSVVGAPDVMQTGNDARGSYLHYQMNTYRVEAADAISPTEVRITGSRGSKEGTWDADNGVLSIEQNGDINRVFQSDRYTTR